MNCTLMLHSLGSRRSQKILASKVPSSFSSFLFFVDNLYFSLRSLRWWSLLWSFSPSVGFHIIPISWWCIIILSLGSLLTFSIFIYSFTSWVSHSLHYLMRQKIHVINLLLHLILRLHLRLHLRLLTLFSLTGSFSSFVPHGFPDDLALSLFVSLAWQKINSHVQQYVQSYHLLLDEQQVRNEWALFIFLFAPVIP